MNDFMRSKNMVENIEEDRLFGVWEWIGSF